LHEEQITVVLSEGEDQNQRNLSKYWFLKFVIYSVSMIQQTL